MDYFNFGEEIGKVPNPTLVVNDTNSWIIMLQQIKSFV